MRVTMVLATSAGGIGAHVRSLVERLPDHGMEVTIACPVETERRFGFTALGATFEPTPIAGGPRPSKDWMTVRRLRATVERADVVHAHGFRAAALAGLAVGRTRPGRTPLIATWHNAVLGGGPRRRALGLLEALAARRADITLGASSDLVERAHTLGATDSRLAPVAAPAQHPAVRSAADVRAELGAGDTRPIVLAVGRLAPQKDYDTLLRAAASWRDREARPLVVVAGDGPELPRLRARIDAERLPVRLLGQRDDVPDLLGAADVYVLTSHWEARAMVIQEAMTAGVPVVTTAVGGVPELVGDGAILVPPGSPDAVAAEVSRLLDDPDRRAALVAKARAIAATWPDEDETARQVARVYREVLGR